MYCVFKKSGVDFMWIIKYLFNNLFLFMYIKFSSTHQAGQGEWVMSIVN